jgi:hypothetical protein
LFSQLAAKFEIEVVSSYKERVDDMTNDGGQWLTFVLVGDASVYWRKTHRCCNKATTKVTR